MLKQEVRTNSYRMKQYKKRITKIQNPLELRRKPWYNAECNMIKRCEEECADAFLQREPKSEG